MLFVRAGLLVCVACGRVGFEDVAPGPDATDPALGALACGASRTVSSLDGVPLGLGLVATPGGVFAAWSGASASLTVSTLELKLMASEIVAADRSELTAPFAVGELGLANDGRGGYLLSYTTGNRVVVLPVDAALTVGAASTWTGTVGPQAIAEPVSAAGAPAVAWLGAVGAEFTNLDSKGAPAGVVHAMPGRGTVSIRKAAGRHITAWTDPTKGCAVWGFDRTFAPLATAPVIHLPGGICEQPVITRHDASGTNLLAWTTDAGARGQRGTDTELIDDELDLGDDAALVDVATAPSGFFAAAGANAALLASYVPLSGAGPSPIAKVARIARSPFRVVAFAGGAVVASVADVSGAPHLQITRLCEP